MSDINSIFLNQPAQTSPFDADLTSIQITPDEEAVVQSTAPIGTAIELEGVGYIGPDYRPNKHKMNRKIVTQKRAAEHRPDALERVYHEPSGQDYLSGEESRKRRTLRGELIRTRAIQIWEEYKNQRNRYKKAKKLVSTATEKQKENPTQELKNALEIVAKGPPITKEQCVQRAEQEIFSKRV